MNGPTVSTTLKPYGYIDNKAPLKRIATGTPSDLASQLRTVRCCYPLLSSKYSCVARSIGSIIHVSRQSSQLSTCQCQVAPGPRKAALPWSKWSRTRHMPWPNKECQTRQSAPDIAFPSPDQEGSRSLGVDQDHLDCDVHRHENVQSVQSIWIVRII